MKIVLRHIYVINQRLLFNSSAVVKIVKMGRVVFGQQVVQTMMERESDGLSPKINVQY